MCLNSIMHIVNRKLYIILNQEKSHQSNRTGGFRGRRLRHTEGAATPSEDETSAGPSGLDIPRRPGSLAHITDGGGSGPAKYLLMSSDSWFESSASPFPSTSLTVLPVGEEVPELVLLLLVVFLAPELVDTVASLAEVSIASPAQTLGLLPR
jgi:hypothetical protein